MRNSCKVCGYPVPANDEVCKTCGEHDRDDYKIVREYLRANPNSNAMQVAIATGISVSKILRYIRNGSLSVIDNHSPRR